MKADVILGLQWGDEGKGKIVDYFAPRYDVIARFQGGPNAGHTICFHGNKYVLHIIPSGIFHPGIVNVIGNGVVVDPVSVSEELGHILQLDRYAAERLLISDRAHLILPSHRLLDAAQEAGKGQAKIGSTLKGIGPAYTDKTARCGLRIGDVFQPGFMDRYEALKAIHFSQIEKSPVDFAIGNEDFLTYEKRWKESLDLLKKLKIINTLYFIQDALKKGKKVLAEGAQGTMLDIDFGSYPFVTSSNTSAAGVCQGLGISPRQVGHVFGVFKAYCTRVGSGPFPTELHDATGDLLRKNGHEYGATTGRPRRTGWLDLVALDYSVMLNGVDSLIMMKADVLSGIGELRVCESYKIAGSPTTSSPLNLDPVEPIYSVVPGWDVLTVPGKNEPSVLSDPLKNYISRIENHVSVPVKILSVGPDREETLVIKD